jgi:hypothetical protein
MKRPGDTKPERPGGRALQRQRQFDESRGRQSGDKASKTRRAPGARKPAGNKRSHRREKSNRRPK